MKEGVRQIGSPSESLGRQRRRRKGTTFSSSKQRWQRELRRKQIQDSRIVEGELSWRLGYNIRLLVLEPIPKEAEASDCMKRLRFVALAMEDVESDQPSLTT